MKNTLTVLSKVLVVFCILCAVYCAGVAVYYYRFPQNEYDMREQVLQHQIDEMKQAKAQQIAQVEEKRAAKQQLETKLSELETQKTEKTATCQKLQADVDGMKNLYNTILETRTQYGLKVRQLEEMIQNGETDVKICYLTFDDGPNNLTKAIVEKLAEHEVYATFFTIGTNKADGQAENLRREIMGGHTIANHTYSHYFNGSLYRELAIFTNQVNKQDQKVFEATGFHTQLFRFPSGSTFCPFKNEAIKWLEENGYKWADWNASGWDSGFHAMDATGEEISSNVMYTVNGLDIAVVLLHDFNYGTYDALDIFIPQLKDQGYVFLPMFPESITLDEPLNPV